MRKPLLIGSVVFHAVVFGALGLAAFWRIEKLPVEDKGGVVASFALPKDPGGGAAPRAQKLVPKEQPKVVPDEIVQPKITKEERHDAGPSQAKAIGDSTEGPAGNGGGGNGLGKGLASGDCAAGLCDAKSSIETPVINPADIQIEVPKTKVERVIVAPSQVKRISGDGNIEAPTSVKQQMQRDGISRVIGSVKLCVDIGGNVTSASTQKSTGYDPYDDKLVSEMKTWTYEPYRKDDKPTPFCTSIQLVYVMR